MNLNQYKSVQNSVIVIMTFAFLYFELEYYNCYSSLEAKYYLQISIYLLKPKTSDPTIELLKEEGSIAWLPND